MYHIEKTMVFDHPNGTSFVISHDGTVPDSETLLNRFGVAAEHRDLIVPFGKSRQRPLSDEEKAAERAAEAKANVAFAPGAGAVDPDVLARLAVLEEQLGIAAKSPAKK